MKYWALWMIAGILSLVGGIFAFFNPFVASLTAELLAGWVFTLVGIISILSAIKDQGWGARIYALLLGALLLILGINLIAHPLSGLLSLTYAVAIILVVAGIFRLVLAFSPDFSQFRFIMILSGILSIVLAVLIFSNFPASAAIVLGIYLAIELISNGISLIAISLARKPAE